MSRLVVFLPLFYGSTLYAVLRGGWSERAIAVVFAIGVIVSPLVQRDDYSVFAGVEVSLLVVDALVFAGLLIVALRSEKFWPLWMTAIQGVVMLSHLSGVLPSEVMRQAYASAEKLWSYPQLVLIAAATWRHRRVEPRNALSTS